MANPANLTLASSHRNSLNPPLVQSAISYVLPKFDTLTYSNVNPPTVGRETAMVEVPVTDVRPEASDLSLDVNGFVLRRHTSTTVDFQCPAEISDIYLPELAALIREETGALQVFMSTRIVHRCDDNPSDYAPNISIDRTANIAHLDWAGTNGVETALAAMKVYGVDVKPADLKGERIRSFTIWRALSPPPQDRPLALLDRRSIQDEDFIVSYAVAEVDGKPAASFEARLIKHSPRHRWCYISNMTPDEVLIFQQFDSAEAGGNSGVPHSGFDIPALPPETPKRRSIEARAFCVY